jgi:SPOR domain
MSGAVTGVRLFVAVAAALALAGGMLPAAGLSSSDPVRHIEQECAHGLPAYNTGPELVFGRVATASAADALRTKVVAVGFENAAVEQECTGYRVVVRGYDTFDTAVALQAEARRTPFSPTVECYEAPDKGGELEAVLGVGRDLPSTRTLQDLAASRGYVDTKIEPEPCGGYEVIVTGFSDRTAAESFVSTAFSIGFGAFLETNS